MSLQLTASKFEKQLQDLTYALKEELGDHVGISSFFFRAEVSGRLDGDIKIEYTITDSYNEYSENKVMGNGIVAIVEEMLHRRGFSIKHTPLCLPNARDEISPGFPDENYISSKENTYERD